MPAPAIAAILVILLSGFLIFKNAPINQPQPTADKGFVADFIKQVTSPSPSPTPAAPKPKASIKPSTTPQPSPSQTTSSSSNSNSNNSGSNQSTSTSTPTPTPSASSTSTPTPTATPTTGGISGTIKDGSGNPIPYAAMQITCNCFLLRNGGTQGEQADGNGNFNISGLPNIELTIKPFSGTWGTPQTVQVLGGQTINLTLVVN